MIWFALAAQLSLPIPQDGNKPDVRAVFTTEDMPVFVERQGVTRYVPTRTTVGLDGMPQSCGVERSSGNVRLDGYTCSIIKRRAKFFPAKWMDGSAVYGVLRVPVIWAVYFEPLEDEIRRALPADMEISVNELPGGARGPVTVQLMLAVEANGRVFDCGEWMPPPNASNAKRFPELVPIACRQMMSSYTAIPAKDASGRPVRSVQSSFVAFFRGQ